MRSRVLVAVLVAGLFWAAPALGASIYTVTGFGDSNDPRGCGGQVQPGLFQCPTLRDAVLSAAQDSETDTIVLAAGTYTLTTGQLPLDQNVAITGAGARLTTVQAASEARVFEVAGVVNVSLANLTLAGGAPTSGNGGDILVGTGATVGIVLARVTGGNAATGGGIANLGTMSIQNSLIDGNQAGNGGGIYNDGSVGAAQVSLIASTIANNTASEQGGGILSSGNASNTVQLLGSTVARNSIGGVALSPPQNASAYGSIIANNGQNCQGAPFSSGQTNIEDTSGCLPAGDGNLSNTDPQLAPALSDQGGQTNVLTIPASSPAVDHVLPCLYPIDQRTWQRVTSQSQPCDAGAYEQSATGPDDPEPTPTPAPPAPTPTPAPPAPTATPAPTPAPTPVANKSVGADPVSGTVLIKVNGKFVPLKESVIPNGAEIDARKGIVEIHPSDGGVAKFYDGIFKISQANGVTTLTLTEPLDCKKAKGKARATAKKPKTRKLWGDGKGKFRTKGSYSAATIRGTRWLVTDTCTTTTTKVTEGAVTVQDLVKKKTIVVRKGKSYVARARPR